MKTKKLLILVLSLFCMMWSVAANTYTSINPSSKKELSNENSTSITIKCNISNCEIYINSRYQGRSNLEINNLSEGTYNLEVRKEGYASGLYKIKVKKGYSYTYSIKMRKLYGYIDIKNITSDCEVYLDGSKQSLTRFEADVGSHVVTVKKFGYKESKHTVTVTAYDTTSVTVNLAKIDFALQSFSISRDTINPDYTAILNRCEITFFVTADGSAEVFVEDFNGDKIWSRKYNNFSTWQNTVVWNGRDSEGNPVEDGLYNIGIHAGESDYGIAVMVTRNIYLPLISITPSGGGIGTLPMAYHTDASFIQASLGYDFNMMFNNSYSGNFADALQYSPVYGSLLWGLGKWGEAGGSFAYYTLGDYSAIPVSANIFGKLNLGIDFDNLYWNFELIARYGFSSVNRFAPYGVDTGNGLGFGFGTGLDSQRFYFGLSTEFIMGPENGIVNLGDKLLKSGAALAIKPTDSFNIDAWFALHSAFGVFETYEYANKNVYGCRAIEGGLEFKILPAMNRFLINTGVKALYILDSNLYITGTFGLSCLF